MIYMHPFKYFSIQIICSESNKSIDTTFHYGTKNSHEKIPVVK